MNPLNPESCSKFRGVIVGLRNDINMGLGYLYASTQHTHGHWPIAILSFRKWGSYA